MNTVSILPTQRQLTDSILMYFTCLVQVKITNVLRVFFIFVSVLRFVHWKSIISWTKRYHTSKWWYSKQWKKCDSSSMFFEPRTQTKYALIAITYYYYYYYCSLYVRHKFNCLVIVVDLLTQWPSQNWRSSKFDYVFHFQVVWVIKRYKIEFVWPQAKYIHQRILIR